MNLLLILNAAAAVVGAVFGLVAFVRPRAVPPHVEDNGPFVPAYAGRAVALAVVGVPALIWGSSGIAAAAALALGIAQAFDVIVFLRAGVRRGAVAPVLATLVHVVSAVVILAAG